MDVVSLPTALQVKMLLPSKAAAAVRLKASVLLVRYLAGDLALSKQTYWSNGAPAKLRQLSMAVRRAGAKQSTLVSFSQVESSSGTLSNDQPLCVDSAAVDARGAP